MSKEVMKDFKQRLLTSAISLVIVSLLIVSAPYAPLKPIFVAAVAAISSLALVEFFEIAKIKGVLPYTLTGIIVTILHAYAVFFSSQIPSLSALPLIVLGLFFAYLFLYHFSWPENALTSIAVTFFGMIYVSVTLSGWIRIVYFFPDSSLLGQLWLVYLLAVTKMTDVGALFVGRFLGRRKLLPAVSPNKTVEGAIGGILVAILTSMLLAFFLDLGISISTALFLGFILSLFAAIGDLSESLLKRDGGIKDSGRNIPGLGGILDMVDSLIFTTPVVYLFLRMAIA